MESLGLIANNLANSSTAGFKADREIYGQYAAREADAAGQPLTLAPALGKSWTDFAQGSLQHTGKSTDLALSGPGFFVLQGPSGALYSRAGGLRVSPTGSLLSGDGLAVIDRQNRPIQLLPNTELKISSTGDVIQNGIEVAQLQLVTFDNTGALQKVGNGHFEFPAGRTDVPVPRPANAVQVHQGHLEASNVEPAESAVRMMHVLRQFEWLQKAMTMDGEMNRRVLDEVAKVHG